MKTNYTILIFAGGQYEKHAFFFYPRMRFMHSSFFIFGKYLTRAACLPRIDPGFVAVGHPCGADDREDPLRKKRENADVPGEHDKNNDRARRDRTFESFF
jgi:hypothetical protein